jgi:hypothetical protein
VACQPDSLAKHAICKAVGRFMPLISKIDNVFARKGTPQYFDEKNLKFSIYKKYA